MHPYSRALALLCLLPALVPAPPPAQAAPAPLLLRHDKFNMHHIQVERAQNMTVCPFVVVMNIKEGRVPRAIKELQCEASAGSGGGCCGGHRRHHCVELRDQLPVNYPQQQLDTFETVSVGCSCMRHDPRAAAAPPTPHH